MNDWGAFCVFTAVFLVVSNLWFLYRVVLPLRRLVQQTTDLTRGSLSALDAPCGGIQEIDALRRSLAGMAHHVRRVEEQRQAYTATITNGQEAERTRIAHELHDDTMQSLIALAQTMELAAGWVETDAPRATELLNRSRVHAVESVDNLRRLIADLRPPALEELGLVPALTMLAGSLEDAHIRVVVETENSQRRLDEAVELALFRSVQEALNNIQRHSQAQKVTVRITYLPNGVQLRVCDDGKGFVLPERIEFLATENHFGLLGIRERVQQLGGTLKVISKAGCGTELVIEVLLAKQPQPGDPVRDPVCSALIQPDRAYGSRVYQGQQYYFCCPVCEGSFQHDPELYVSQIQ